MLSAMSLLKFDAGELTDAAAFLDPLCFSVYSFGSFRSSRYFLSTSNESFSCAQQKGINDHYRQEIREESDV